MRRLSAVLIFLFCFTSVSLAQTEREVTVDVALAEALKAKVKPNWVVYVYATVPGARLPLASQHILAADLPRTVILTERMNLLPGLTLAGANEIELVAKVSESGQPHKVGPNDLRGRSEVVYFGGKSQVAAKVLIDQYASER